MHKNIFLFYIISAFHIPYFWIPVLYIYLTSVKGLNPAEAAFLLSLQEFLLIFLEIPTGVVADKISRKFSVGLGYILANLPFLFFPFVHHFYLYVLLFGIKAVGKALVSGADTSLLYDTLLDLDRTKEYKQILTKGKALAMGVAATCIFLGGLIAQFGYLELTLVLHLPFAIIGTVAAILMQEPETSKKAKVIQDKNYLLHTLNSVKTIVGQKKLVLLVLIFAITEATALNMKWYYTPLFEELGFNLLVIGSIVTLLYVAKSLFSALGAVMLKHDRSVFHVVVGSALVAVAFVVSAIFFTPVIVVLSLLVIILLTESLLSILSEEIHHSFESHHRATAVSIVNVASSLVATITLNAFGVIQLHASLYWALLFLATTFAISTVISLVWKKSR